MDTETKKSALKALAIIVLGIGGFIAFGIFTNKEPRGEKKDPDQISSFEECVEAGNPVMESYPEQCTNKDGTTFVRDIGNELEKLNSIQSNNPRPGQMVSSPIDIKGKARGFWFFEAIFPIELTDADGKIIGNGFATTEDDWTTEQPVSFVAELYFETPTTNTGTLILRKDNSSGLLENDDALFIPVRFR